MKLPPPATVTTSTSSLANAMDADSLDAARARQASENIPMDQLDTDVNAQDASKKSRVSILQNSSHKSTSASSVSSATPKKKDSSGISDIAAINSYYNKQTPSTSALQVNNIKRNASTLSATMQSKFDKWKKDRKTDWKHAKSRGWKLVIMEILDVANSSYLARLYHFITGGMIIASLVLAILSSTFSPDDPHNTFAESAYDFEIALLAVLATEYVLRVLLCPRLIEHQIKYMVVVPSKRLLRAYRLNSGRNGLSRMKVGFAERIYYLTQWVSLLDLAVLAESIAYVVLISQYVDSYFGAGMSTVLRLIPIMRLMRFERYIVGGPVLWSTLVMNRLALVPAFFVIILIIFTLAVLESKFEDVPEQDGAFDGVVNSLWWSVVTVSTTGYGDLFPKTFWGRAVAAIGMLISALFFGIPSGIIGTSYALRSQRHYEAERARQRKIDNAATVLQIRYRSAKLNDMNSCTWSALRAKSADYFDGMIRGKREINEAADLQDEEHYFDSNLTNQDFFHSVVLKLNHETMGKYRLDDEAHRERVHRVVQSVVDLMLRMRLAQVKKQMSLNSLSEGRDLQDIYFFLHKSLNETTARLQRLERTLEEHFEGDSAESFISSGSVEHVPFNKTTMLEHMVEKAVEAEQKQEEEEKSHSGETSNVSQHAESHDSLLRSGDHQLSLVTRRLDHLDQRLDRMDANLAQLHTTLLLIHASLQDHGFSRTSAMLDGESTRESFL